MTEVNIPIPISKDTLGGTKVIPLQDFNGDPRDIGTAWLSDIPYLEVWWEPESHVQLGVTFDVADMERTIMGWHEMVEAGQLESFPTLHTLPIPPLSRPESQLLIRTVRRARDAVYGGDE